MRMVVTDTYADMSQRAAQVVADAVRARPWATIVVPTGATPEGFYAALVALHRRGVFDASRLRVFQLDEYLGLGRDDPRSFYAWIKRIFLDPLGIASSQVVRLPGEAAEAVAKVCRDYDQAVRAAGGFDIAVLGLGGNGHLGFNEPPADPESLTRAVRLSAETVASNARYWGQHVEVPPYAVTCGMANLLAARLKVLLVAGDAKRGILRQAVTGPISAQVPASFLQQAENVIVITDVAAWPWRHPVPAGTREE